MRSPSAAAEARTASGGSAADRARATSRARRRRPSRAPRRRSSSRGAVTCQRPVMPCGTRKRSKWCGSKNSVSYGMHGRGPTSDISPRRHVDQLRQLVEARLAQEPAERRHGVLARELVGAVGVRASRRASSSLGCTRGARLVGVDRHRPKLERVNGRLFAPSRVWRKNTGPGDSRRIRIAATAKNGEVRRAERRRRRCR